MESGISLSRIIMDLERIARELEGESEVAARMVLANSLQGLADQLYRFAGRVRTEAKRDA